MATGIEVSKKLFLVNSVSSVATRVLNISVLVWLQQHLLRRISPEAYAIYPLVASVMLLMPLFSTFLTIGIYRYLIDAYARRDERRVTELISSILPVMIVLGGVLTLIGLGFATSIDRVLSIAPDYRVDARLMMVLLVIEYAANLLVSPFAVAFDLRQKYLLKNLLQLGQQVLRLAVLALLLFGVSTRVLWVVVATFIASGTFNLARVILAYRLVPALRFRPALFRWSAAREMMSFGFWQVGSQASEFLYNAQSIVLNHFATAVHVNCFYVSNMIDSNIRNLIDTAADPIQPALGVYHAREDRAKMGEAYLRAGRYLTWMALAAACPLGIFSTELIHLYIGSRYGEAAIVLTLLMLVYPFIFSSRLIFRLGLALGRLQWLAVGSLIKQFLNLSISVYLVWAWNLGALGSAIGVLSSQILMQLFFFWPLGLKFAEMPLRRFLNEALWSGMQPALAGTLVWLALKWTVHPATWLQLGLCAAAGYPLYLAVIFLCLRPHERRDLSTACMHIKAFMQPRRAV